MITLWRAKQVGKEIADRCPHVKEVEVQREQCLECGAILRGTFDVLMVLDCPEGALEDAWGDRWRIAKEMLGDEIMSIRLDVEVSVASRPANSTIHGTFNHDRGQHTRHRAEGCEHGRTGHRGEEE